MGITRAVLGVIFSIMNFDQPGLSTRVLIWLCALLLCAVESSYALGGISHLSPVAIERSQSSAQADRDQRDREVGSTFAPIFYQALGDKPRSDYITNFDFDGDWRGNNNWENVDETKFPLKGYVYYSVTETATHFFIHYALFHPRDYKGGELKGRILSELIREGVKRSADRDPTGLMAEAGVAHENDLEGVLVVVARNGNDLDRARVVFVETFHHNDFSKYVSGETTSTGFGPFRSEGQRVLLYVEPKGHGIEAYLGDEKQTAQKEFLIYKFTGKAEDPDKEKEAAVGYDLVPIQTTLWSRARVKATETSELTYSTSYDYGMITIRMLQPNGRVAAQKVKVGKLGLAFAGDTGGLNMAKAPWGWFDKGHREQPLGLWFFDPATIVKQDFHLDDSFSTAYVHPPFWANDRVVG